MPRKISVNIPKELNLTAAEKAKLKKAFASTAIRTLKRPKSSVGAEIINVSSGGERRRTAKKKPSKKAAKKR